MFTQAQPISNYFMATETKTIVRRDYRLDGPEGIKAIEKGLAEAKWYTSPVPRDKMRELLRRRNGPAIIDTLIWFGLLFGSGYLVFYLWGTWWAALPYLVYSVIYGSTSDSRWHESLHGTAFKSDWMNNLLFEIASFMIFRQSIPWRWSHTRHHSDTLVRGRDAEIAIHRPPIIISIILEFFSLKSTSAEFKKLLMHCIGKIDSQEKSFIPKSDYPKVFRTAWIYLSIYLIAVALAIYFKSILPLMYVGLPTILGAWLMRVYGYTQHAGLEENVLDHRLNSRTVYMNRIHRYLYWNMNYHVEHHMFPLVPYHALPKLHELIKHDLPKPNSSIINAFREIIPAVLKQRKDVNFYIKKELPTPTNEAVGKVAHRFSVTSANKTEDGLIEICSSEMLAKEDVIRLDCDDKTYAVYRTAQDKYYATDGICTHGSTHLVDGLVIGDQIECPKHNGRFSIVDGSPQRPPVCAGLKTYEVTVSEGKILINIDKPGGKGLIEDEKPIQFKVVSNDNVASYIKELVLEPLEESDFNYKPGDYIQLDIPAFEGSFERIEINHPFARTWKKHNIFHHHVNNTIKTRRNYSMATNPNIDTQLKFNVRIALPPIGIDCNAGVGSSYVFMLKPGDVVSAVGPFGDFHIKDSDKEMIYLGGGAGMAPLRAHISYLFETLKTKRKLSYWYGARSLKELYYVEYFEKLAKEYENFSFHVALSEPLEEDNWESHTGFIHEIFNKEYLSKLDSPKDIEYYLCGPPAMVDASKKILSEYKVPEQNIAFDEF